MWRVETTGRRCLQDDENKKSKGFKTLTFFKRVF